MVERRKRQRTEVKVVGDLSPPPSGLIEHPTVVPEDAPTLIIPDSREWEDGGDENFSNFFNITGESVLGKMESIYSSLAVTSVEPLDPSLLSLVPRVSDTAITGDCEQLCLATCSPLCILNRLTVETVASNIELGRVRSFAAHIMSCFRVGGKTPPSLETYMSFVASILNSRGAWGFIQIPVFGSTCDFVYVDGHEKAFAKIRNISLSDLEEFGVNFSLQQQSIRADNESSDDDNVPLECPIIVMNDRVDIFGFFDYIRSVVFSKPAILISSCPFRGSECVSPEVSVKTGVGDKRFILVDGCTCPLVGTADEYLNSVLVDPRQAHTSVSVLKLGESTLSTAFKLMSY